MGRSFRKKSSLGKFITSRTRPHFSIIPPHFLYPLLSFIYFNSIGLKPYSKDRKSVDMLCFQSPMNPMIYETFFSHYFVFFNLSFFSQSWLTRFFFFFAPSVMRNDVCFQRNATRIIQRRHQCLKFQCLHRLHRKFSHR